MLELLAACVSFAAPPPGSACAKTAREIEWLNPPARIEPAEMPGQSWYWEPALGDPALAAGVYAAGEARFTFRAAGRHLVEVFVIDLGEKRNSYVLEAGGVPLDTSNQVRPGPVRLSPGDRVRSLSMQAVVAGGSTLVVRTDAPRYLLSAIRWTPQEVFEKQTLPRLEARLQHWRTHPVFGVGTRGATARRNFLQQLGDRLRLSARAQARREGLLALVRAWYWVTAENHQPRDIERTAELFQEALKLAPDEPILQEMISSSCLGINSPAERMPHGPFCQQVKPVPWEVAVPAPPAGAPRWAVEQRRLTRRLDALTRWWVEDRQQPNGELGGGWGDDVEILRSWGPQALGLGSEVAARGLKRMADGLWASGILQDGYDRGVSDVEHSSEPTTDTLPLRAAAFPDDAEARSRLGVTAACAHNWIVPQPDGHWRFRSAWFNCRQFDPSPARALDVHLNTRAMGPALWHAYLSRDPKLIELLVKWAEAWTAAMRSTEHGKPAGIFPSVVKAADGSYLVGSEAWDKPSAEWDYFQWTGGSQEALASLLLAVHDLTGEKRWLGAVEESFQILERCEGARGLCEQILRAPEAFYEWRRRTGKTRFDKAFGHAAASGDAATFAEMEKQAREMEARLGVNFHMYTSEVIWTDRVYYRWPSEYRQRLFGGEAPRGDRYPTFAVTWPPIPQEFARAVLEATPSRLRVAAYNFQPQPVNAPVRLWRLEKGRYQWTTGAARGEFVVSSLPHLAQFPLPPQREVVVQIRRAQR